MKFDEFVEKVKAMGGVDTDGYYGKQCMDLYNYYCNNVLGVQNVGADCAKNILKNQNILNAVEVIENYPEFIVQKGDIVVFRKIGQYGHVAICLGPADINGYKCIEQNWSNTRQLEEVWHDYLNYNPIFLRPKNQENIKDNDVPYIVQVTADALNVRTGPGTNYPIASHKNHCIRDKGKYTIVEEKGNWGRLKSGAGWICLDYTKKI